MASTKSAAQLWALLPEYTYDKTTPHEITNGALAHLFYNECNKKYPETISKIKELTGLNIKNGWMRSKLCSLHDFITKKLRHLNSGSAWETLLKELEKSYSLPFSLTMKLPNSTSSTATPSSVTPSTVTPSTVNSSTVTPSTVNSSTVTPSTVTPSSVTPSSVTPSSVTPSTVNSSTVTPSSVNSSTVTPSTATPSSVIPSTDSPSVSNLTITTKNIRVLRRDCKGCLTSKLRIVKLESEKSNLKRKLCDQKESFLDDILEIKRKLMKKSQNMKTVKKQYDRKATIETNLRKKRSDLKAKVECLTKRLERMRDGHAAGEIKKLKIQLSHKDRMLGKKNAELESLASEIRGLKRDNKELQDANDYLVSCR